nr:unnamed protein product [Haemonchus contortus]
MHATVDCAELNYNSKHVWPCQIRSKSVLYKLTRRHSYDGWLAILRLTPYSPVFISVLMKPIGDVKKCVEAKLLPSVAWIRAKAQAKDLEMQLLKDEVSLQLVLC